MNTRHMIAKLGIALLSIVAGACNDNIDREFVPLSSVTRSLMLNGGNENVRMTFNAGSSSRTVEVESNTRWTVEVVGGGGWCMADVLTGVGNGSFSIRVLENTGEQRSCKVRVTAVDADGNYDSANVLSKDVEVVQEVSNVRLSPSTLEPFPSTESTQTFDIVANVSWTLDVTYDNPDASGFITLSPIENMSDKGNGIYEGSGNARFLIALLANGANTSRLAFLNLRSETGEYTVEILQNKSDNPFDVSPSVSQTLPAIGGTLEFNVLSLSSWKAACSESGVTLSPASGRGGNERETVTATIAPNTTREARTFTIRFTPDYPNFLPQAIDIVQQAFDMTFAVGNTGVTDVVAENGGNLHFDLDSRFDWRIETPTWISADATSGSASTVARSLTLTVNPNTTDIDRTGTVYIYPQSTPVADNAFLDPATLGIEPLRMSVTQFGGREPAISAPWLLDDYTQTTATLEFNFYSPYFDIVEAGLEWAREDGRYPGNMTATPSSPKDCTVSFALTGLNPATQYIARGYVKDSNGTVKYGAWSYPFTTGGRFPGNGDNPTPSN